MSKLKFVKDLPDFNGNKYAVYELPTEWKDKTGSNYLMVQKLHYTVKSDNHDGFIKIAILNAKNFIDIQFTETIKEAEYLMTIIRLRDSINNIKYRMQDSSERVDSAVSLAVSLVEDVDNTIFQ